MAAVLLVGAFGQRNVGDEALCSALCSALHGHDITIASSDPDLSTRLHGHPTIPAGSIAVFGALRGFDAIVVGGGTVFKNLHHSAGRRATALLWRTLGLTVAARFRRVPVAFVGVGAGNLDGNLTRTLTRAIVPRADLLVLRDEESAAVLTTAGLRPPFWIGADPAWSTLANTSTRAADRPGAADRSPQATVALSHLAFDGDAQLGRLGTALAHLADRGWRIRLQPWQDGPGDRRVAEHLLGHVPDAEVIDVPVDLATAAAELADDDLVIAMRFHAIVAAGAARCRIVAVAHEPKLVGLARRLDQISVPPGASAPVIAAAIDWAVDHAPPTDAAISVERDLADTTIRLMRLLVDGGRIEHPEELPTLQLSDGERCW